ncbi:hypothetical protein AZE42_09387 [Rhizopogon vesiculosus]|uniref:Hydrophobin n=1 Tax=Rhizopogon vesiculosus TaxID=180088 RepID=A0A1J8PYH7_9AGAM|nr:hypothetical protein AZE42_09387 [Rhizopogon vesiculosus]
MNISGVCPLRRTYMLLWWIGQLVLVWNGLGNAPCMGDPCNVPGSLDCCKTLPRPATTIIRMGRRGLFHSVDENSSILLCNVGSSFECGYVVPLKLHTSCMVVSCLELIGIYAQLSSDAFTGGLLILHVVQSFVLGPRLILGIREYHAKLVGKSDEGTDMISIAFQERIHITTGTSV